MRIIWLTKAREDILIIDDYLSKDSVVVADMVVSKILIEVRVLLSSPGIGRPGRVKSTRELVLLDIPYIIAYRVKDSSIEILRVLHQSRIWPASLWKMVKYL